MCDRKNRPRCHPERMRGIFIEYKEEQNTMKKIRTITLFMILVISVLALTGCGKYPSSWSATMCVHSSTSSSNYLSFSTFSGTEADKLKVKEEPGTLCYSAKLEKGSATVYVDYDGTKKELFSIKGGEEVNSKLENLKEGEIYVILETSEKCEEGKFEFEIQ